MIIQIQVFNDDFSNYEFILESKKTSSINIRTVDGLKKLEQEISSQLNLKIKALEKEQKYENAERYSARSIQK